jgi:hypothetical protein
MKTNISTAVLKISDANVAKDTLGNILKIVPDAFQEFITELLLGVSSLPDVFPTKVTKEGTELAFLQLFFDEMAVSYTFETQISRFFDSQEAADIAIEKRSYYSGNRTQSDEYPIEAVITYIDSGQISLKEWLELSQQGE